MIINQISSGKKPSGTIRLSANYTFDVADYALAEVVVPTTAPDHFIKKKTDDNGKLINSTNITTNIYGANIVNLYGATDVGDYVLAYAYTGVAFPNNNSSVDLSPLTTISGNNACISMFQGCAGITSVDMSSLTTISGSNACDNMFSGCTDITSFDLSSLTTVSGSNGCQYMFKGCTGLTGGVSFDNLTKVAGNGFRETFSGCTGLTGAVTFNSYTGRSQPSSNSSAFYSMFQGCTGITSVNMPALEYIASPSGNDFRNMFQGCTGITSVNMPLLQTVAVGNAMNGTFSGCTGLTTFDFPSLSSMSWGYNIFSNMFENCTSLTRVSFYALNTNSFSNYTNIFDNMLSGVTGCTVHFPMRIQSKIGSWTSVTNGFGGTNTTVLFDIVCTLTGADSNTYTRKQKESTSTATAWTYNDTLYYTSGTTEPTVGATIYSDAACTTAVTTIDSIA